MRQAIKTEHALKAEMLKKYWPRSGRYCQARLSYRYEAMEKGVRHALKAEMLKNIGREAADIAKQGFLYEWKCNGNRTILGRFWGHPSVVLGALLYYKTFSYYGIFLLQFHGIKKGVVKKILAAKPPICVI